MAKIDNVHTREIAAPAEVVGEILDTLGSADDRVWANDIWVAEPVVFDRPLAVGAAGGHGSIRYSVVEYEPGRRLVFRFSPGGGLSGTHGFELEPVGRDRTRIRHFLDARTSPWMRPLVPVLIGWHDAMVETAFDRVEVEATGSLRRPTPIPRWLRIVNRMEIATARRTTGARLPNTAHTSRPWRIHEIASDFEVEDVWALPTPGGPDDFPRLVRFASDRPVELNAQGKYVGEGSHGILSRVSRALFELRWKLGQALGWDDRDAGVGRRVATLRDRLPADLRAGRRGPDLDSVPMTSLYLTGDEWAAEMANRTVHSVMHIGWVPDGTGGHRGQMAVLVKPNGWFGVAYMAAIKPFRHLVVYPALMRSIERFWQTLEPSHSHA